MELIPPPIRSELTPLAKSFPASGGTVSESVRQDVLEFMAVTDIAVLSTVGGQWPVSHCMHFATLAGPGQRPVVYLFTHKKTRKLANIQANPRVSLTLYRPDAASDPTQTPYLKLRGVCSLVEDKAEREIALQSQFTKVGYEFTRYIGLEKQPGLRIDAVECVWANQACGASPQWLDYRDTFDA